jgi:GTP-binding nuclear protein Ran
MANSYKIILIGAGGVGKTTYVKKLLTQHFETKYVATLGVEVHQYKTDSITFNLWDTAGQEKFGGLGVGFYIGGRAAMVFVDLTNPNTKPQCYTNLQNSNLDIPIVLCGTKSDLVDTIPEIPWRTNEKLFIISNKKNVNLKAPLIYLESKLTE